MDFKPGERFKYNNAAFIVLGLIIEEISGMNFREYISKNVFEKYGTWDISGKIEELMKLK